MDVGHDADAVAVLSNGSGVWGPGGRHAATVCWGAAAGNESDTIMLQGAAVLVDDAVADAGSGLWNPVTPCTRE